MPDEQRPETGEEQIRCKRCGASLRGLEPDANCQACGTPVSKSLFARADERKLAADDPVPDGLCCSRCGESLNAVAKIGRCPRCEMPVEQSLAAGGWRSAVGADGVVESDTACRKCGYNLRGLADAGNCPECGTAVRLSTRGDFLCYADPAWSRKIARGSVWISRGIISMAASLTVGCCFGLGLAAGGSALVLIPFVIGALAFVGGLLAQYIGTWIITTPDPALPPHASGVTARKLIRVGLFVTIVDIAVGIMVENAGVPQAVWIAVAILDIPLSVIAVITTVAYFGYLAKLTARIPNDVLTRRAVSLKLWTGLGVGIFSLMTTTEMLYEAFAQGTPATGISASPVAASARPGLLTVFSVGLGLVGGLILLISAVRTIGLQWQFATAAREQAKRAEVNWGGAQPAGPPRE